MRPSVESMTGRVGSSVGELKTLSVRFYQFLCFVIIQTKFVVASLSLGETVSCLYEAT